VCGSRKALASATEWAPGTGGPRIQVEPATRLFSTRTTAAIRSVAASENAVTRPTLGVTGSLRAIALPQFEGVLRFARGIDEVVQQWLKLHYYTLSVMFL
jgi:hypothetical protein